MEVLKRGRTQPDKARKFICRGCGALLMAKRNEACLVPEAFGQNHHALIFQCVECLNQNIITAAVWDENSTETINP